MNATDEPTFEKTLTPRQVAKAFGVNPKTVTRWAKSGHLKAIRTPGGHRRYRQSDVELLINLGEDQ